MIDLIVYILQWLFGGLFGIKPSPPSALNPTNPKKSSSNLEDHFKVSELDIKQISGQPNQDLPRPTKCRFNNQLPFFNIPASQPLIHLPDVHVSTQEQSQQSESKTTTRRFFNDPAQTPTVTLPRDDRSAFSNYCRK